MTTLTNSFHGTSVSIRAHVGDAVSRATVRRAYKALCGMAECTCCREDGTRDSRYSIADVGPIGQPRWIVVDQVGAA